MPDAGRERKVLLVLSDIFSAVYKLPCIYTLPYAFHYAEKTNSKGSLYCCGKVFEDSFSSGRVILKEMTASTL